MRCPGERDIPAGALRHIPTPAGQAVGQEPGEEAEALPTPKFPQNSSGWKSVPSREEVEAGNPQTCPQTEPRSPQPSRALLSAFLISFPTLEGEWQQPHGLPALSSLSLPRPNS